MYGIASAATLLLAVAAIAGGTLESGSDTVVAPTIVAAGDIACGAASTGAACMQGATSDIVTATDPDAVLVLGDNQYECGELADFRQFYDPTWGRAKSKTFPVVGNHEYNSNMPNCPTAPPGAAGYFTYFGAAASPLDQPCSASCKGYYSFNLGSWHLIALNSVCSVVGCGTASAQGTWLAADLAAHPNQCLLAYYHHPRYTSGPQGDTAAMAPLFSLLYQAHADVVLNGHDHDYERFAPLDPNGAVDVAHGIREFVVGTGGRNNTSFTRVEQSSEVRDTSPLFGVLRLTLRPTGYDWRFLPVAGELFADAGSGSCHSAGSTDTTPPTAPTRILTDTRRAPIVDLSWTGAADDTGVIGYEIRRDGAALATVGGIGTYADVAATPGTTHRYDVFALDAAGNRSTTAATATVTVPAAAGTTVFRDDFESADISRWTAGNLVVDAAHVHGGRYSARAATSGAPVSSYEQLPAPQTAPVQRILFRLAATTSSSIDLVRLRTASNRSLLTFFRTSSGKLADRNDMSGTTRTSTTDVTVGDWHELQVQVQVMGTGSTTLTQLDGIVVPALSQTENLGTDPVGRIQLGEDTPSRVFDVSFDDVATATTPFPPLVFHDGFESGDLRGWTFARGVSLQQAIVDRGSFALRATAAGSAADAYRDLQAGRGELWYRARFFVVSQGPNSMYVLRERTSSGSSLLGVYLTSAGTLSYRNDVAGTVSPTAATPARNAWHTLLLHTIAGAGGHVDLWLDGLQVASRNENLGATPIGRVEIGDAAAGKTFDLVEDEVTADTAPLDP
jgi:hypothetical protein